MRNAFRATPVAVMIGLVAGCTASPASAPTADATRIASVAASSAPDATPTQTPMASPAACAPDPSATAAAASASSATADAETPLAEGPLEPGRYTTTHFEPRVALTLGSGWAMLFEDDVDELAFEGPGIFMGFGRVTRVVDPVTGLDEDAPSDLIAWLAQHDALTDTCTGQGSVGQLPGTILEAAAARTADLFYYPTGNFRVVADSRFRWYVLTVEGQELTITIAGPAAGFDSSIADVESVLDTVEVFP